MNERCRECLCELSACGEMTADGPRMDCPLCLARAELADLREAVRRLGVECRMWREHRRLHDERSVFSPTGKYPSPEEYDAYKQPREAAWFGLCEAREAVDAHPTARKAVEESQA